MFSWEATFYRLIFWLNSPQSCTKQKRVNHRVTNLFTNTAVRAVLYCILRFIECPGTFKVGQFLAIRSFRANPYRRASKQPLAKAPNP